MRKMIGLILLCAVTISGCGKAEERSPADWEAADVADQEKWMFEYIGLGIDQFEELEQQDDDAILQKWYKSKVQDGFGAYIAIGNVHANGTNVFPEMGDYAVGLDGGEDYLLEITIGPLTEDGHMAMTEGTRSYYFVQEGRDILFSYLERY